MAVTGISSSSAPRVRTPVVCVCSRPCFSCTHYPSHNFTHIRWKKLFVKDGTVIEKAAVVEVGMRLFGRGFQYFTPPRPGYLPGIINYHGSPRTR